MAASGPSDSGVVAINGKREPAPIVMEPDVAHRIRFASIPSNERVDIALVKLGADTVQVVQQWTVLAVDGAELPVARQRPARSQRLMATGMTMDVAFVMSAQDRYAIRVRMLAYEASGFAGSSVLIPLVSTSVSDKR